MRRFATTRARWGVGATSALLATIAAASIGAGPGVAGTTNAAHSSAATIPAWAKPFVKYTGGTAGKANPKLAPISIGWVNDDGGVIQNPGSTTAAEAAVKVINSYLGGIGGHPVQLAKCSVVSGEEQGQTCAEQLLNNSKVKFITEGVMTIGAGAFHQTLKGKKPVIGFNPVRAESATAKHTYEVTAGLFGTTPGFVSYLANVLKAKTVSVIDPGDDPAGAQAAQIFAGGAAKAGIKATVAPYQSAATDLVAPLSAAGASTTDATVVLLVSTPACVAGAHAIDQLGVKHVLSLALCLIPDVASSLGDYPKWTYIATNESGNLPKADPYVASWLSAMKAYKAKDTSPFPQLAFGTIMTDAKLLNQVGYSKFTSASFEAALKGFKGPSMFGPPNLKWGSIPGLPALGSTAVRLYSYQGSNKWADATGGKWVGGQ